VEKIRIVVEVETDATLGMSAASLLQAVQEVPTFSSARVVEAKVVEAAKD
jgi:hypothetical protein